MAITISRKVFRQEENFLRGGRGNSPTLPLPFAVLAGCEVAV